jgi:ribonuclease P protein component
LKQFTLSRHERLKSRKQIDHLFSRGKYFNFPPLRVIYEVEKMELPQPLQFGVGVSVRHFKKATDRNRVKRLLREAWRLQKIPLQDQLREKGMVLRLFVIYTGRELPDHELVSAKMSLSIQRLAIVINETDPAHT